MCVLFVCVHVCVVFVCGCEYMYMGRCMSICMCIFICMLMMCVSVNAYLCIISALCYT